MDQLNLCGLTIDQYLRNESEYLKLIKENPKLVSETVPLLNHALLQDFRDNTLVRFRGMIQDMNDSEIYLEKYEVISESAGNRRVQVGRYRDVIVLSKPDESVNYDGRANVHGERRSLFLVTIPGLNEWAENVERLQSCVVVAKNASDKTQTTVPKRSLDVDADLIMDTGGDDNEPEPKRTTTGNPDGISAAEKQSSTLSAEYLLNSPLPDRPSKACICKIYVDYDSFTLNTVVEMVGFLSVDPSLDGSAYVCNEFEDITEIQAANPPPSLIPRLHCITSRALSHVNPLLVDNAERLTCDSECLDIIKDLRMALAQCLFGDVVAADYLLCHLISTVYVQTEMETIGQFSLNLSNLPAACLPIYIDEFYGLLASMMPATYLMPLTLDALNTDQFTPK